MDIEKGQISEMLFQEGQHAGWAVWMPGGPIRASLPTHGVRERVWVNLFCFLFSITSELEKIPHSESGFCFASVTSTVC